MQKPYEFVTIVEQLRYQVRWSQTPRVPPTSVLGHSYYVAVLALLLLRQHEPCPKREYNVFFGALFHDLPETVTRDIVSPVKSATKTFPHVVKRVEERVVQQELVPTMDDCFRDELLYFTADEFTNRVKRNGCECRVSFEDLDSRYNKDEYDPIDGELVRVADHMAAFVEAERSCAPFDAYEHLKEGKDRIKSLYLRSEAVSGM